MRNTARSYVPHFQWESPDLKYSASLTELGSETSETDSLGIITIGLEYSTLYEDVLVPLDKRSANYFPWTKLGLASLLVNKVLLVTAMPICFHNVDGCSARAVHSWLVVTEMGLPAKVNYSISGHLQKKLADPCLWQLPSIPPKSAPPGNNSFSLSPSPSRCKCQSILLQGLEGCFWNFKGHMYRLAIRCESAGSDSVPLEWGQDRISNKPPGHARAAGLRTTLWGARL